MGQLCRSGERYVHHSHVDANRRLRSTGRMLAPHVSRRRLHGGRVHALRPARAGRLGRHDRPGGRRGAAWLRLSWAALLSWSWSDAPLGLHARVAARPLSSAWSPPATLQFAAAAVTRRRSAPPGALEFLGPLRVAVVRPRGGAGLGARRGGRGAVPDPAVGGSADRSAWRSPGRGRLLGGVRPPAHAGGRRRGRGHRRTRDLHPRRRPRRSPLPAPAWSGGSPRGAARRAGSRGPARWCPSPLELLAFAAAQCKCFRDLMALEPGFALVIQVRSPCSRSRARSPSSASVWWSPPGSGLSAAAPGRSCPGRVRRRDADDPRRRTASPDLLRAGCGSSWGRDIAEVAQVGRARRASRAGARHGSLHRALARRPPGGRATGSLPRTARGRRRGAPVPGHGLIDAALGGHLLRRHRQDPRSASRRVTIRARPPAAAHPALPTAAADRPGRSRRSRRHRRPGDARGLGDPPRWRSVVRVRAGGSSPAPRDRAPARLVSALSDYEIWRQVHRLTGLFPRGRRPAAWSTGLRSATR